MHIISTNLIWLETFPELVRRWYDRQDAALREKIGSAADASIRAERRGDTILEFTRAKAAPRQLRTPREWDTRWDPKAAWEEVAKHVRHQGWEPVRLRGPLSDRDAAQGSGYGTDRPTVVVAESALAHQSTLAARSGLAIRLDAQDLAPIALARELYFIASGRIGGEAAEWAEELAPHWFVQKLLGLPFNPLVFSFLED